MPPCPYLIGLDIGTSSAKTVILDRQGRLRAWAEQEYGLAAPQPEWAEQDPQTWVAAAADTIRSALAQAGCAPGEVAGIGLSGQMHGLVCVDAAGRPLRPALIWADRRSKAQVVELQAQIGAARLAEWTGNPLATGFMLPSWMWLRQHEPQVAAATRTLLLPKDYVRYRLTGALGAEPSDASSTLLFDPHQRAWCLPLLEQIGLSPERLPPLSASAAIAGGLLAEFAAACGLSSGTPVVFGGSDVSMQALAQGIFEPGMVSCTIGSGGQLCAPLAAPRHDPELRLHLFCHALPERWHLEAAILAAGLALRWLRDRFWPDQSYGALAEAAQAVEAANQGLFFLPYLAGERTPVMDPAARAAFAGLSLEHGQAHIVRAVMEGVVFALHQGLDLLRALNTPIERLVATGGAIRHPLWLQLQADIFNCPIYPANTPQASACGAALLAGLGLGVFASPQAALQAFTPAARPPVLPDPARAEKYERAYQTYKQLYPALRATSLNHRLR